MTQYLYPQNLKATANLWLWGLRDFCILGIAALCLTAFMQTSLLFLGLLTFPGNMLLGLGIMLAANEVPRIAQQFGLDSSVRVNMMSVVHATTTAVNLTRSVARSAGK